MAGKVHFVGDDQHRAPLLRQLAHNRQHLAGQLRVKRRGRLIEIDDLRVCSNRTGNRHTLLLPARKLAGVGIGTILHADLHKGCASDFLRLGAGHFAGDDQPLRHILQRRFVGKQVVVLEHKPRAAAQSIDIRTACAVQRQLLFVKQHRAGIRTLQKVQAAQHRRFSATAGAENRHHIALVHIQVNALQNLQRTKGFFQIANLQHGINSFVRRVGSAFFRPKPADGSAPCRTKGRLDRPLCTVPAAHRFLPQCAGWS